MVITTLPAAQDSLHEFLKFCSGLLNKELLNNLQLRGVLILTQ